MRREEAEKVLQERHPNALKFMKLTLERDLSEPTLDRILDIMSSQPTSTLAYQKGLALTDILENSKTEEEFLQKMEVMEK